MPIEFSDLRPIYLQIADVLINRILELQYSADNKLPSIRELSIEMGVNSRTVLKAMDFLAEHDIAESHRGMGYYLKDEAITKATMLRKTEFFNEVLPQLAEKMKLLDITAAELQEHLSHLLAR